MGNLTIAVTLVWTLNLLMFLTQASMMHIATEDLNAANYTTLYDCDGTMFQEFSANRNCKEVLIPGRNEVIDNLPTSSSQVDETSGIGFLDTISTAVNWLKNKVSYVWTIMTAPYVFLKSIPGVPSEVAGGISLLWYALSLFLFIAFIIGRND